MINNQHLLESIEDAERAAPFCATCGAHTTVVERDGSLWLECSSIGSRGRLRALLTLDLAAFHTRQLVHQVDIRAAA